MLLVEAAEVRGRDPDREVCEDGLRALPGRQRDPHPQELFVEEHLTQPRSQHPIALVLSAHACQVAAPLLEDSQ